MSANEEMLELLEDAATRLGVKVSYEALQAGSYGGLCRVKGEYRLIVDKKAPLSERVATMAHSLAPLDWSGLDLEPRLVARLRQVQMRPDRKVPARARDQIKPDDPVGLRAS